LSQYLTSLDSEMLTRDILLTDKQTLTEVSLLTILVLLAIFHNDLTVPYIGQTS